jgi:hypothetical protein
MSALGQKRTYAVQNAMSVLRRIATAKAELPQKSCPLYPQKRTCAVQSVVSALGQKRTLHFRRRGSNWLYGPTLDCKTLYGCILDFTLRLIAS